MFANQQTLAVGGTPQGHQHGFPTPMAYEFKWKVPASRNKDSETGMRPKQAEIRMKLYQIEVWKVLILDVFLLFLEPTCASESKMTGAPNLQQQP